MSSVFCWIWSAGQQYRKYIQIGCLIGRMPGSDEDHQNGKKLSIFWLTVGTRKTFGNCVDLQEKLNKKIRFTRPQGSQRIVILKITFYFHNSHRSDSASTDCSTSKASRNPFQNSVELFWQGAHGHRSLLSWNRSSAVTSSSHLQIEALLDGPLAVFCLQRDWEKNVIWHPVASVLAVLGSAELVTHNIMFTYCLGREQSRRLFLNFPPASDLLETTES